MVHFFIISNIKILLFLLKKFTIWSHLISFFIPFMKNFRNTIKKSIPQTLRHTIPPSPNRNTSVSETTGKTERLQVRITVTKLGSGKLGDTGVDLCLY